MIVLDPTKPGVYTLTKDVVFEKTSYLAFLKAGGKIVNPGFRMTLVLHANPN